MKYISPIAELGKSLKGLHASRWSTGLALIDLTWRQALTSIWLFPCFYRLKNIHRPWWMMLICWWTQPIWFTFQTNAVTWNFNENYSPHLTRSLTILRREKKPATQLRKKHTKFWIEGQAVDTFYFLNNRQTEQQRKQTKHISIHRRVKEVHIFFSSF